MTITSRQRSKLKGLAQNLVPIAQFGKNELSPEQITMINEALTKRELIKCTVLESSSYTPQELAERLAEATGSAAVQTIGRRFVLYRPNPDKPIISLD